jgi:hypothetical protein
VIVGSGKTQKDALKNIESVIPKKKIEHIYLFQLRAKK